jgi:Xaa-Pro aminopeptidase
MSCFAERRNRLRQAMAKDSLAALLVSNETNVSYLTGFLGDSSFLLITQQHELLLTDTRYEVQLAEECPGLELAVRGAGTSMVDFSKQTLFGMQLPNLGIEGDTMTVAFKEKLSDGLPGCTLCTTSGLVETLRQIKDADEIAAIRRAVRLAEEAIKALRADFRRDLTEKQLADELEHRTRLLGAKCGAFPPIVAADERGALPHARPTSKSLQACSGLLIDWGADEGRYKSDLTRFWVTGRIPPKLERAYGVVLTAQRRAIDAIRPGAVCKDVDALARKVIFDAGLETACFRHGLGHGIGMNVHEAPRFAPDQETKLAPGMIVTVEPAIYVAGQFGIRLEDDVLVTPDGHEVLSSYPKEFADAVVA